MVAVWGTFVVLAPTPKSFDLLLFRLRLTPFRSSNQCRGHTPDRLSHAPASCLGPRRGNPGRILPIEPPFIYG